MTKFKPNIQDRKIGTKFGMLDPGKIYDFDETDEDVVRLVESGILVRINDKATENKSERIYHKKKKKKKEEVEDNGNA